MKYLVKEIVRFISEKIKLHVDQEINFLFQLELKIQH